jgi:hypothetical protein
MAEVILQRTPAQTDQIPKEQYGRTRPEWCFSAILDKVVRPLAPVNPCAYKLGPDVPL